MALLAHTLQKNYYTEMDSIEKTVFHCQMCGHCCEGQGGIIVSPNDLLRLSSFLQLSDSEVIERFGEKRDGKLQIRTGTDGYCIFFRQGKGCTVHEGKPDICRAWPFFRGNLIDSESFAMAKDFCPGIDKDASHATFSAEGKAYLSNMELLAHDTSNEANALILEQ